jgi:hypothetical protein
VYTLGGVAQTGPWGDIMQAARLDGPAGGWGRHLRTRCTNEGRAGMCSTTRFVSGGRPRARFCVVCKAGGDGAREVGRQCPARRKQRVQYPFNCLTRRATSPPPPGPGHVKYFCLFTPTPHSRAPHSPPQWSSSRIRSNDGREPGAGAVMEASARRSDGGPRDEEAEALTDEDVRLVSAARAALLLERHHHIRGGLGTWADAPTRPPARPQFKTTLPLALLHARSLRPRCLRGASPG